MDYSLPGSSVYGDFPSKNTERVSMPSSRGSSQLRDQTQVSRIAGSFFIIWAPRKAPLAVPFLSDQETVGSKNALSDLMDSKD